jgi:hypothetical protein
MKINFRIPKKRCAIAILLLAWTALTAHAQQYSIAWYKVAGGGGTSTNGQYSVSGTTHQPNRSLKELWVQPLDRNFRQRLCQEGHE